ncbi:MAG: Threonylcarbamoyl-AMP synthase [Verrucomicrobiota bacterium]
MEEGPPSSPPPEAPPHPGASSFIFPPTEANLRFFAKALCRGMPVAIPTETVYGLAAIATNPDACRAIFTIKGRPFLDPLIVHVRDDAMARQFAVWNPAADALAAKFWPGPLSIILPKKSGIPPIVTAGRDTVALRAPSHWVPRQLIEQIGLPLAAPSANPFGYISPSLAVHVAESFGPLVPYVIDGGPCEVGLESTIVDLSDPDHVVLLRPGAISAEAISSTLDLPVASLTSPANGTTTALIAPGTMASHYSPKTPLSLFSSHPSAPPTPTEAVVFLSRPSTSDFPRQTFWLSERGEDEVIGRSLFALLRSLDKMGWSRIHCQTPTGALSGTRLAIGDRLARAAADKPTSP